MKRPTLALAGLLSCLLSAPLFAAPPPAHDPFIEKAFREVIGRAPQGAEWNIQNYGHGHWSSYDDLLAKVRVRAAGQGVAYIFIKPQQALYQGHIGWAYMLDDGSYCYGSTENPMKAMGDFGQTTKALYDALYIPPDKDNGFWYGFADTEQEMLADMKAASNNLTSTAQYPLGYRCSGYWHYKKTFVKTRGATAANNVRNTLRNTGFRGITWNCLDQAYAVLEAYGVDKVTVMPWKQTHPSPNYWFNDFGHWDEKNGTLHPGNNNSGYPL